MIYNLIHIYVCYSRAAFLNIGGNYITSGCSTEKIFNDIVNIVKIMHANGGEKVFLARIVQRGKFKHWTGVDSNQFKKKDGLKTDNLNQSVVNVLLWLTVCSVITSHYNELTNGRHWQGLTSKGRGRGWWTCCIHVYNLPPPCIPADCHRNCHFGGIFLYPCKYFVFVSGFYQFDKSSHYILSTFKNANYFDNETIILWVCSHQLK